jgi:lysophospholipase L1-like esterase
MKTFLLFSILTGFLQMNSSCSKATVNNQTPVPPVDTVVKPVPPPVTITDTNKTYLALGDSYTIGQSIPTNQNYPNQTVALLDSTGFHFAAPDIIAVTGWTTANLLAAIANKPVPTPAYDIVTLLIGVNNQFQGRSQAEYKSQFITLLQKSIAYAGNRASHVVVVSIPDYSVSPYGQQTGNAAYIAVQIDSFNLINKQVADSFNVQYVNVTDASRKALNDPTLFANDGLHFSGKEYAIWSAMLAPVIENALK